MRTSIVALTRDSSARAAVAASLAARASARLADASSRAREMSSFSARSSESALSRERVAASAARRASSSRALAVALADSTLRTAQRGRDASQRNVVQRVAARAGAVLLVRWVSPILNL